jgi:hypothetical protein
MVGVLFGLLPILIILICAVAIFSMAPIPFFLGLIALGIYLYKDHPLLKDNYKTFIWVLALSSLIQVLVKNIFVHLEYGQYYNDKIQNGWFGFLFLCLSVALAARVKPKNATPIEHHIGGLLVVVVGISLVLHLWPSAPTDTKEYLKDLGIGSVSRNKKSDEKSYHITIECSSNAFNHIIEVPQEIREKNSNTHIGFRNRGRVKLKVTYTTFPRNPNKPDEDVIYEIGENDYPSIFRTGYVTKAYSCMGVTPTVNQIYINITDIH